MRQAERFVAYMIIISAIGCSSSAQKPANPPAQTKVVPAAKPNRDGETVFRNNCDRCHTAPEDLSPRITGTVLRHMRVRANLSAEDERRLLEYLAP